MILTFKGAERKRWHDEKKAALKECIDRVPKAIGRFFLMMMKWSCHVGRGGWEGCGEGDEAEAQMGGRIQHARRLLPLLSRLT